MYGLNVSDLFLVINNWPKIDEARISVVTDGKCVGLCGLLADHVMTMTRIKNPWIGWFGCKWHAHCNWQIIFVYCWCWVRSICNLLMIFHSKLIPAFVQSQPSLYVWISVPIPKDIWRIPYISGCVRNVFRIRKWLNSWTNSCMKWPLPFQSWWSNSRYFSFLPLFYLREIVSHFCSGLLNWQCLQVPWTISKKISRFQWWYPRDRSRRP